MSPSLSRYVPEHGLHSSADARPCAPARPTLVFAHANGYPPGSYRLLLTQLSHDFDVYTFEHRPLWIEGEAPRFLPWSVYANDLLNTLDANFSEPVWLVGHSMGAVVSTLVASLHPERVAGLVALDPVLLPAHMLLPVRLLSQLFAYDIPIAKIALNRPQSFQGYDAAFAFYRSKRPFRRLSDEALWDYVHAGHETVAGHGVRLRWSGAWEACVYRSAPSVFGRLKTIKLPMLGIAGRESDVLTPKRLKQWRKAVPQLTLRVFEGGHLIPLEEPERCAHAIKTFIAG